MFVYECATVDRGLSRDILLYLPLWFANMCMTWNFKGIFYIKIIMNLVYLSISYFLIFFAACRTLSYSQSLFPPQNPVLEGVPTVLLVLVFSYETAFCLGAGILELFTAYTYWFHELFGMDMSAALHPFCNVRNSMTTKVPYMVPEICRWRRPTLGFFHYFLPFLLFILSGCRRIKTIFLYQMTHCTLAIRE